MWASLAPGSAVPRARGPLGTHPSHGNSRARLPLRASSASDDAPIAVPHSGYHRTVGVPRTFFEGWYFRVTLPESRDNLSLIYHVYDPDLPDSPRRAAGAQVCAPGGGYLFRESKNVDAFRADPHALELRMPLEPGVGVPTPEPANSADPRDLEPEFFEVSEGGARHRGRLTRDPSLDDPAVWPASKRVSVVEWDFRVRAVAGYGGDRDRPQLSTAGWLSALPVFEPHYQVLVAHGLATGWVETDGVRAEFRDSPAYAEKNWGGAGFPVKWFWVQCNAFPTRPGLSVTATGANRGVVLLPGTREEVAAVMIHDADGNFYPFVPAGSDPAEVRWEVAPWGFWRVTAKTSTHEVEITATIEPEDAVPGGTTVLRAPVDDPKRGMAPLCRESFRGAMRVSLWEREGRGWGSGARGRCILDAVASDVAVVEVGGGPWDEDWVGTAEMREPLGTLAAADVDVRAVADFLKPLGDVVPGL